jgi:hypothetical protein
MNVGTKSSLLSLAVAETATPARYTAALHLGRAERSHHFGIVTLFNHARFHCIKPWRALLATTKML